MPNGLFWTPSHGGALPITPERVAKLRAYGLSEYASRTYLALLDLGTAEARDVSGISKVPASKIYRILEQLHEKGLVEMLPEFPRKYAPVPFSEFLDKMHADHKQAAARIARERDELTRTFAVMGDVESSDRGGFTVIRGRRNVLARIDEIVRAARRSLFVHATPGCLQREGYLAELVAPAAERGVRVRLLLPRDAPAPPGLVPSVAVRAARPEDAPVAGMVVVADASNAILVHFVPDDGHAFDGNDVAVSTDQPGVAGILDSLVEVPWLVGLAAEGGPEDARFRREVAILAADPTAGVDARP